MVLQEHDWNVENALQVLEMFSEAGGDESSLAPCIFVLLNSQLSFC